MSELVARIVTCPERHESLARTLEQFRKSDWQADPIVHMDAQIGHRMDRINANWHAALSGAAYEEVATLIVEDDVDINAHVRHNLEHWQPIGRPSLFATLYNAPPVHRLVRGPAFYVVDGFGLWGSQGIVVSPAMARHILAHWGDEDGFADTRMPRLAASVGPVYCHVPSLVQHVGTHSTWGGKFHQAPDFDRDWKSA